MSDESLDRYYDVLEIKPDATFQELERAYRLMRRIYSAPTTAASVPAMREFSETRRQEILEEIEEAYGILKRQFQVRRHVVRPRAPEFGPDTTFSGEMLRRVRMEIGITVAEMAEKIHVRRDYLEAIESENFALLPQAVVYVRGFVQAYLEYLGMDETQALDGYMARYREWCDND